MKRLWLYSIFVVMFFTSLDAASWSQTIANDVIDTLATGIPVACGAAALWAVANRIPHEWDNVEGSVAEFVYTTWEEQGFLGARKVLLKRIPATSFLARIIVYTQELPGALAMGEPFIFRIAHLLKEKERILQEIKICQNESTKNQGLQRALEQIEEGLDECRFVCGHERVHKERHHTYQLLVLQFLAPFFVYTTLKHSSALLEKRSIAFSLQWILKRNVTRTLAELFVGWARTRAMEKDADIYASKDLKILRAGLRLFKRALIMNYKLRETRTMLEITIGWIIKYTHPTLSDRVNYLTNYIEKKEKEIQLQSSVELQLLSERVKIKV